MRLQMSAALAEHEHERSLLAKELDDISSTSEVKVAELTRQLEESRAKVRTYCI